MGKATISVACDRGNTGIKLAVNSEGQSLPPFKMPSVLMKVPGGASGICIKKDSWLCGAEALKAKSGERHTPMEDGSAGKISYLSVVVAQAIYQANKVGGDFYLNVAVSTPFAGNGDAITKDIQKELSKLSDGFSIGGVEYKPELYRVGCAHEGLVILETNPEYDGVIDMGFGTILGGYRRTDGSIQSVTSERGGCVNALEAMRSDERFLSAIQKAGFSAAPSTAKLSSLLSDGRWEVKGIDFRKFLDARLLQSAIEDMHKSVVAGIKRDDPYKETAPRLVLIGGAACLLRRLLSGEKLQKWADGLGLEVYESQPDYQTALILSQLQKTNPERFAICGDLK